MSCGTGQRNCDVVILSSSPVLSDFIADNVSRSGLTSVSVGMNRMRDIGFAGKNPRVVFVDFAKDVSIAAAAQAFPTARIAVLAGLSHARSIERQSDTCPFFDFIEKPCSAADILSVLPHSIPEK